MKISKELAKNLQEISPITFIDRDGFRFEIFHFPECKRIKLVSKDGKPDFIIRVFLSTITLERFVYFGSQLPALRAALELAEEIWNMFSREG